MTDEYRLLKSFYDSVGENYAEEEAVYLTLRGKLRKQFVLEWLSRQRGRLLEVGTNRGMYIQHYDGGERYGIDLSQTVLKHAHRTKPVTLLVADAERLHCFKENTFARVLCSEVIEHCFQPVNVLQSIFHVLLPGGTALITTPNYKHKRPTWIPLGSLKENGVEGEWGESYYHTAFRPEELEAMAVQVGFHTVETGTLEKQVKYAAKIPAVLLLLNRQINRFVRCSQYAEYIERCFQKQSLFFDALIRKMGLESFFLRFVREGVRSFIIVKKPVSPNQRQN